MAEKNSAFNVFQEIKVYTQKNFLKLVSGSMARKYNSIIAHFTLVCIANIFLEFHRRWSEDERSIGALFEDANAEINDLPFDIALQKLLSIVYTLIDALRDAGCLKDGCYEKAVGIADTLIQKWYSGLPAFLTKLYELGDAHKSAA